MRILICSNELTGGVGRVVDETKQELIDRGHEVVSCERRDIGTFNFFEGFKEVRRFIRKAMKEYNIVYLQDWSIALPCVGLKGSVYCCFHGINPSLVGRVLQRVVAWGFKGRLIVVSENLRRTFRGAFVVNNGVNTKVFRDLGLEREGMGFVQAKTELYNYSKVKEAAKILGYKLKVAEGLDQKGMVEFYNRCKAFISLPPKITGFNLCWLEAMACGVPTILCNDNGIGKEVQLVERKDLLKKYSWKNSVDCLLSVFNR